MAALEDLLEDLVTANRVLASQNIVDSFGHVSVRSPDNPKRYYLSRARAPERVERADIMEFTLEGDPVDAQGRKPYLERFIHGAAYEARPDVMAVIHNHSPGVIPFGITGRKMRPIMHMCATIGHDVPIWDQHKKFGDTNLLVETWRRPRPRQDLGQRPHRADARPRLRRGRPRSARHGLHRGLSGAERQAADAGRGHEQEGPLSHQGRNEKVAATTTPPNVNRAWENWCRKADRPYKE